MRLPVFSRLRPRVSLSWECQRYKAESQDRARRTAAQRAAEVDVMTDRELLKTCTHLTVEYGDRGYGDYIILDVSADGQIAKYERPEPHPEEWVRLS